MVKISDSELRRFQELFLDVAKAPPEMKPVFLDINCALDEIKSQSSAVNGRKGIGPFFIHGIKLDKKQNAPELFEKLFWLSEKRSIIPVDFVDLIEFSLDHSLSPEMMERFLKLKGSCYHVLGYKQLSNISADHRFNDLFVRLNLFFSMQPKRIKTIGLICPSFSKSNEDCKQAGKKTSIWKFLTISKALLRLQHDHEYIPEKVFAAEIPEIKNSKLVFEDQELETLIVPVGIQYSKEFIQNVQLFHEKGGTVIFLHPRSRKRKKSICEFEKIIQELFGEIPSKLAVRENINKGQMISVPLNFSSKIRFEIFLEQQMDKYHDPLVKINELVVDKRQIKSYVFKMENATFFLLNNDFKKQKQIKINFNREGQFFDWMFQEGTIQREKDYWSLLGKTVLEKVMTPSQFQVFQQIGGEKD